MPEYTMETAEYQSSQRPLRRTLSREGQERTSGVTNDFNALGEQIATLDQTINSLAALLKPILATSVPRPLAEGEERAVKEDAMDVDTRAPLRQRITGMMEQLRALDNRLHELMDRAEL